jgi:hypothetical protein
LPIRKKITVVRLKTHFVPAGLLASLYHAYYQYFVRRVADSPPNAGRKIGRIKATHTIEKVRHWRTRYIKRFRTFEMVLPDGNKKK